MIFFTKIPIPISKNKIDYSSKIVFLGSCFAENMAKEFKNRMFEVDVNPFGIIFNPVSLDKVIHNTIHNNIFKISDLQNINNVNVCLDVHSKIKNINAAVLIEELNQIQNNFKEKLRTSTHVFITLGTAWVYKFLETNEIVANCHKIPQQKFKKRILSVSEIEISLQNIIYNILNYNDKKIIIFTVSPVRHIKDGFVENQQSKAHLITALHNVLQANSSVEYFHSYELMIDELRDYRFYSEDMLHPNKTAITYIWNRLIETYMNEDTTNLMNEVESYKKMISHKPFDTSSETYKKFLSIIEEKKVILSQKINKKNF